MKIGMKFLFFYLVFYCFACTYDTLQPVPSCDSGLTLEVVSQKNSACELASGEIEIQVKSGGQDGNVVQFSLDGLAFQNSGKFEGLSAGIYTLRATDSVCEGEIQVVIENEEGLNASLSTIPSDCADATGSITIEASDFSGAVSYAINAAAPQSSPEFNNLTPGTYQVHVSDEAGCNVELEAVIPSNVAFAEIENIVNNSCAISGCHAGNIEPDFRVKENILDKSARILSRTSTRSMPPPSSGQSLNDSEIDAIECWVNDGARGE